MSDTAITINVAKPRDVLLHGPAKLPLDDELSIEKRSQPADVVVGHIARFALRINARLIAQPQGQSRPDAVQIAQRNVRRFVRRDIHAENTRHRAAPLTLALLVARIRADHQKFAVAAHELTVLANPLYA
jgi:hypothetical protein